MSKKNKNTRRFINEMNYLLESRPSRRMTLEGLVYGEDGEEFMDDGQGGTMPEGPEGQEGLGQQERQMGGMQQKGMPTDERNPLDEDPEIAKLITNIRVETLQGLTKLANNPEAAQYELLKKIFLLIDKAVEDKTEGENQ